MDNSFCDMDLIICTVAKPFSYLVNYRLVVLSKTVENNKSK